MPFTEIAGMKIHYAVGFSGNAGVNAGRITGNVDVTKAGGGTSSELSVDEDILLLVHGAGGSHKFWSYQLKGLSGIRVIAVDLPGHGLSEGESLGTVDGYTKFIREFAGKVINSPFYLAGYSMGGAIALNYALRYGDGYKESDVMRLKGLILVATGARLRVAKQILNAYRKGEYYTPLIEMAFSGNAGEKLDRQVREWMQECAPQVYYNDFSACDKFDVMQEVERIKVPALVAVGTKDVMTPVKYSKYLADKLKNARLEIIPGAGHLVMLEKPEGVNRAIKNFITAWTWCSP